MRQQLRLSGSGGQGVITAAIILAEAAVSEGKEAVQSQSYGPEARGGASKSEVIIDDAPIYHPHVQVPDLVLALTQKAADKYYHDLNPAGLLVLDTQLVPEVPDFPHVVRIPFTQLAVEQCGRKLFTNIVALGALVRLTGIVQYETIKKAVAHRVPPATVEKNMQALQVGWDAAAK
ncbi:MAG: 2-oxoacid:acceptor oxidoreductase family protein [Selenomonadaceae bacterium]|nr:2-oxoacid:acceptor oxidoreductase family protein [Selenomonadaceae bacterium]